MFDNLKNMANLMSQAKEMRAKMEQAQAELSRKTVEADAGAGAVRVTMNGKMEVISVRIDKAMIATLAGSGADADQAMVEDLLTAAFNAALVKAQELIKEEMSKVTGGLNLGAIPGLDKLMGG